MKNRRARAVEKLCTLLLLEYFAVLVPDQKEKTEAVTWILWGKVPTVRELEILIHGQPPQGGQVLPTPPDGSKVESSRTKEGSRKRKVKKGRPMEVEAGPSGGRTRVRNEPRREEPKELPIPFGYRIDPRTGVFLPNLDPSRPKPETREVKTFFRVPTVEEKKEEKKPEVVLGWKAIRQSWLVNDPSARIIQQQAAATEMEARLPERKQNRKGKRKEEKS